MIFLLVTLNLLVVSLLVVQLYNYKKVVGIKSILRRIQRNKKDNTDNTNTSYMGGEFIKVTPEDVQKQKDKELDEKLYG